MTKKYKPHKLNSNIQIRYKLLINVTVLLQKIDKNILSDRELQLYIDTMSEIETKVNKVRSQELYHRIATSDTEKEKQNALKLYLSHKERTGL